MNLTCPNDVDGLKFVGDHLLGNQALDEWNLPTLVFQNIVIIKIFVIFFCYWYIQEMIQFIKS